MAVTQLEVGSAAFAVDVAGARTVELEAAAPVRAASVLKPLLAWTAATSGPLAHDQAGWESLARPGVTTSDNVATAALWSRSGQERLVELLNERLDVAWQIADGDEHPSLRVVVTAAELARGYAVLGCDNSAAAKHIRRWMREVPSHQTFGLRPIVCELLAVDEAAVGVKCGWFGAERAHAVVLAETHGRIVGAAVTTRWSPDETTRAAVRDASGNDTKLAAAHDHLFGQEIRSAIRRALVVAGEL